MIAMMDGWMSGGQRTCFESWLSPSTMQALVTELRIGQSPLYP